MKPLSLHHSQTITQAAQVIQAGGLIIYPTDTVYGIGCDATNQTAVDKLLNFKGARNHKAISVAVRDQDMAQHYAQLNATAKNLYHQFLPGPLTVISLVNSESSHNQLPGLAQGVPGLDHTIGIRIIPHPFLQQLFKLVNVPITATSGNISGGPNPRSFAQWQHDTPLAKQELIDLFIDAGELPYAEPSTIIDTSKEATSIVRQGAIKLDAENFKLITSKESHLSHSPQETQQIAQDLIRTLLKPNTINPKPTLIALQGDLGAGKTIFTQGIARALDITEPLRSPTYTLLKEYDFTYQQQQSKLIHIDAWRLTSPEEFADLNLSDYLKPTNLIVIEWPQRLTQLIPQLQTQSRLTLVDITITSPQHRHLTITTLG